MIIPDRAETICHVLDARARDQAGRLAYSFVDRHRPDGQGIGYGELRTRVASLASAICDVTDPGEPVICASGAGLDFLIAFLACLWSGRIATPIQPPRASQASGVFEAVVRHSGARIGLGAEGLDHAGIPGFRRLDPAAVGRSPSTGPLCQGGDVAFLQYTSGTTGAPKGVIIGHRNLMANSQTIREAFEHDADSVGVIWLPPHHDMGLVGGLVQPTFAGFPVYLLNPLDFLRNPLTWLNAVSRFGATTSGGPNFAYDICAARIAAERAAELNLRRWRVAFAGAEPISTATLDRFAQAFAVAGFRREAFLPCYGLAEATLMATSAKPLEAITSQTPSDLENPNPRSYVGCGRPIGADVRIVDPRLRCEAPSGARGEIWLRGGSVAQGYWRDPALTAETFGASLASDPDSRFLRTGDIGFIHDGALHVCGRLKAVIIVHGVNHSLEDIEATACAAHPALSGHGTSAFLVEGRDREDLVIVQEAQLRATDPPIQDEIVQSIRHRVTAVHGVAPARIELTGALSLPRTRSGKLQRDAARRQHLLRFEAQSTVSAQP